MKPSRGFFLCLDGEPGESDGIFEGFCCADKTGVVAECCRFHSRDSLKRIVFETAPRSRSRFPRLIASKRHRHSLEVVSAPVGGKDNKQDILCLGVAGGEKLLLPGNEAIQDQKLIVGRLDGFLYKAFHLDFGFNALDQPFQQHPGKVHREHKRSIRVYLGIPVGVEGSDGLGNRHILDVRVRLYGDAVVRCVDALDEFDVNDFPGFEGIGAVITDAGETEVAPDQSAGCIRDTVCTGTVATLLVVIVPAETDIVDIDALRNVFGDPVHPGDDEVFAHFQDRRCEHFVRMEHARVRDGIGFAQIVGSSEHFFPPMFVHILHYISSVVRKKFPLTYSLHNTIFLRKCKISKFYIYY